MPFVLMRAFEQWPGCYDRRMDRLSLGRLARVRADLLDAVEPRDARVLEVGCGTGVLAEMLGREGARVVAIDVAPAMLEASRRRLEQARLLDRVELKRLTALAIEDAFAPDSFDRAVGVLVLSELSDDEIDCVLFQLRRVLRAGGLLVVADEVVPSARGWRLLHRAGRFAARLAGFFAARAAEVRSARPWLRVLYFVIELPLMLLTFAVLPAPSHPVQRLESRLERAGFRVRRRQDYLGESLALVAAEAAP